MASPRVFISSTYSDLKEVREEIAQFITEFGFTPVTFERQDVSFEFNQLLEDSCVDEVKSCTMLILIINRNFGSDAKNLEIKSNQKYCSVTQKEYYAARDNGIPIFVFINQHSMDDYNAFVNQGKPKRFKFSYLENKKLAKFIEEILEDKSFRFINKYNQIQDIKDILKKQWAGLFNRFLLEEKKRAKRSSEYVKINSFKLFHFRRNSGLSQQTLADKTGIEVRRIQKFEDAGKRKSHIEIEDFESATLEEIQKIAKALNCYVGNLKAGLPDDFLSQYLSYYFKNKGSKQRRKVDNKNPSLFKSKIVIFDFDGTLTHSLNDNLTTWERIWLYLKYDVNDCANLHSRYSRSEITHREWCEITEKKFKERKLSKTDMNKVAEEIQLIEGTKEVIQKLSQNNIKLYITSGSIKYLIKRVLGPLYSLFESVKANEFAFDDKGLLKFIIGTRYDFEGKADFITQLIRENQINPLEAFFVGNSLNDEWAHQSGAQTLCVNPTMTDPFHPFQWAYSIRNMKNLNEIFRYLTY